PRPRDPRDGRHRLRVHGARLAQPSTPPGEPRCRARSAERDRRRDRPRTRVVRRHHPRRAAARARRRGRTRVPGQGRGAHRAWRARARPRGRTTRLHPGRRHPRRGTGELDDRQGRGGGWPRLRALAARRHHGRQLPALRALGAAPRRAHRALAGGRRSRARRGLDVAVRTLDIRHPRRRGIRMIDTDPAILVLEDGSRYVGRAYGARGRTLGEAVFATGMTGYQETLTDPSYAGQIVVMTAPHIGNTGVNDEDPESRRIWVSGYVVRDPSRVVSNFRANGSLDDDLTRNGVVGISGVDTRAVTRRLRDAGSMRAGVFSGADASLAPEEQLAIVRGAAQMAGLNLSAAVSVQ